MYQDYYWCYWTKIIHDIDMCINNRFYAKTNKFTECEVFGGAISSSYIILPLLLRYGLAIKTMTNYFGKKLLFCGFSI